MVNPDRNLYEPPYDDALLYESDLEPERPRSRPLVVLLGIVVLAAFAGVVWVAYNQGVKHGQGGTPPILSADSGPTRIPADPTTVAETKDVAADKSYDRLFGDASDQPETVLPPAEQPRTVASSGEAPAPQQVASSQGGPDAVLATDIPPPVDPRMDSTTGVSGSTELASGSPQPISSAPPTPLPSGSEDITAALAAAPAPAAAPKPVAPKIVSAKPATTAAAPSVTVPIAPPAAVEVDTPAPDIAPVETPALAAPAEAPAPASGGGVAIQLGSFPNDKLAAGAWSKIKSSNQELLGSYSPTIKAAQIEGKGTWYRLRVSGFADKSAAAGVCEQLKATGQACIIASK